MGTAASWFAHLPREDLSLFHGHHWTSASWEWHRQPLWQEADVKGDTVLWMGIPQKGTTSLLLFSSISPSVSVSCVQRHRLLLGEHQQEPQGFGLADWWGRYNGKTLAPWRFCMDWALSPLTQTTLIMDSGGLGQTLRLGNPSSQKLKPVTQAKTSLSEGDINLLKTNKQNKTLEALRRPANHKDLVKLSRSKLAALNSRSTVQNLSAFWY